MRNRQKKREKKNSNPISGPTTAQEKQEQAQTTHHLRTALKQGKARRKRKEEAQPEKEEHLNWAGNESISSAHLPALLPLCTFRDQ